MAVVASLVVGSNGACSLNGRSSGLSTPPDRERFLRRHRGASAFIVGKESATAESYSATDVPIFVFTRDVTPLAFNHPMMQQVNSTYGVKELVELIDQRIEGDIVVEAGPSLLMHLIEKGCIEILELSLSPISGDGNFFDVHEALTFFEVEEDINVQGTRLLKCRYKSNSANS